MCIFRLYALWTNPRELDARKKGEKQYPLRRVYYLHTYSLTPDLIIILSTYALSHTVAVAGICTFAARYIHANMAKSSSQEMHRPGHKMTPAKLCPGFLVTSL